MVKQPTTPQALTQLAIQRLKAKGITPTTDAVAAYVLAYGESARTTIERLKEVSQN